MKTCLKETGWEVVDEDQSRDKWRGHENPVNSTQVKTGMGAINYNKLLKLFP